MNIFFDISLDLQGLLGAPFYFLADWKLLFHSIFFSVIVAVKYRFPKSLSFKTWLKFITYNIKKKRDISIGAFFKCSSYKHAP